MYKNFTLFIVFVVIIGCQRSNVYSNKELAEFSYSDFQSSSKLQAEDAGFDISSMVNPGKCVVTKDRLVFLDFKSDSPLHIYDLKSGSYLGGFGSAGQGPGEIAIPWLLSVEYDDFIFVYDVGGKKILGWALDSLLMGNPPQYEKKFNEEGIVYSISVKDNLFYYTDALNPNGRFFAYDTVTKKTESFGELLVNSQGATEINNAQANRSVAICKNGKVIVASHLCPFFEIYDEKSKNYRAFLGPEGFPPIFDEVLNAGYQMFAATKKTRTGFIASQATDKYIYFLFSGERIVDHVVDEGKHLLIFDYDGNPVKEIELDQYITSFTVHNDSILYGIHTDVKPEILKYTLSNIPVSIN